MAVMKNLLFRQHFSLAVANAYPQLVADSIAGRGPFANSLHDFSVHILTVPSIVTRLARQYGFVFDILKGIKVCPPTTCCAGCLGRITLSCSHFCIAVVAELYRGGVH